MASTYLSRTPASSGTLTTWTYSCWVKRLKTDEDAYLIWANDSGTTENDTIIINSNNVIYYNIKNSNVTVGRLVTNQVFRDTSAWYHIVFVWDTTNATSGDRMRIYVNGERVTSFSTETQPSQNATSSSLNANKLHLINQTNYGGSYQNVQTDILMAHVHFIDGTAYDADTFGETDATTGIWKPKTAPSVTYGTNGFFLKFENSAAFGTDSSGNANNFTVNGTMTQTIDTPSNVFATFNALDNYYQADTLSNGNLTMVGGGVYAPRTATFGLTSGKWYWEIQVNNWESSDGSSIGISSQLATASNYEFVNQSGANVGYGYFSNGSGYGNAGTIFTGYGTGSGTHIIGVALDLDSNKIAWSYDGVWQGSADPSNGTNMISITDTTSLNSGVYFPAFSQKDNSRVFNVNFGNGYFGTTAVSSAENPDDGIGIFEYAVPTGYKALCTKSINAQEYD